MSQHLTTSSSHFQNDQNLNHAKKKKGGEYIEAWGNFSKFGKPISTSFCFVLFLFLLHTSISLNFYTHTHSLKQSRAPNRTFYGGVDSRQSRPAFLPKIGFISSSCFPHPSAWSRRWRWLPLIPFSFFTPCLVVEKKFRRKKNLKEGNFSLKCMHDLMYHFICILWFCLVATFVCSKMFV